MKAKTWNAHNINDTTNYRAVLTESVYGLPRISPQMQMRQGYWPVIGGIERPGREIYLDIYITAVASRETLSKQLHQWFDPDDETAKKLICEDAATGNDRYVYAICVELREVALGAGLHYVVTLRVTGDVYWRENTATTDTWSITASGQTKTLANGGQMDAYPKLQVKPTSAKTGGYAYKRFVAVRWQTSSAFTRYPTDICNDGFDTDALVYAGKMQADGDDLRVLVDGVEADRWLDGINTATTKVWVNLNWQPKAEDTLGVAIASSGAITTITGTSDISDFPSSGILVIDDEVFSYTGKNNASLQFTGVTRAAKGSSMAAHTTSDTIWWCQHEIFILYGNSSVSAPTVDSNYEPAFELDHSTNASWVYEEFCEADGLRTGGWQYQALDTWAGAYGGNQGATADPFVELGQYVGAGSAARKGAGRFRVWNPCGITNANFSNGEIYSGNIVADAQWDAAIQSSQDGSTWTDEDAIAKPTAAATWQSWSDNQALDSGSTYAALYLSNGEAPAGCYLKLEAADCTLTIDSTYTPAVTIGAEAGAYSLECTIANTTTGKSITISFTMPLNEQLEIDTDLKTVTYLDDNSSQLQAMTLVGGARRDWLALDPGNNTISYTDTGTNAVTIDFAWSERHYI